MAVDSRTDVVRRFYDEAPFPGYPPRDNLAAFRARAERSRFAQLLDAAIPPEAWYLSILGVDPTLQGRGIGARLLAPTLAEADAAGAVTWLETFTTRGASFYERVGFTLVAWHDEPTTGRPYAILRRDPP